MPWDIPNYIALPLSLLLGAISSLLVNKYESEIWQIASQYSAPISRIARNYALTEYKLLILLKQDTALLVTKTSHHISIQISYIAFSILSYAAFLYFATFQYLKRIYTLFGNETDFIPYTSTTYIRSALLLTTFFGIITLFMAIRQSYKIHSMQSKLSDFEKYEQTLKHRWPDVFDSFATTSNKSKLSTDTV